MCVSAEVSFGMAGLLIAGGVFAVHKAQKIDARYVPLALFPILVGIQQLMEGLVWVEAAVGDQNLLRMAALGYLFFTWLVWPTWVPYMVARLEENKRKRKLFYYFAQVGFLLGLFLYLPNFWHPDWLSTEIIKHSISYQCTHFSDPYVSHKLPYGLYLLIIALPPLLASQRALKIFGAGLVSFVPVTYFLFSYAQISVLCFFAAALTVYILHVILENKCAISRAASVT